MILRNKFFVAIAINSIFTLFEFAIGYVSGSLSLISDACHNLTDVLSLCIIFMALKIAETKPTAYNTFGYKKVTIAAAFLNGLILAYLAYSLFSEAYARYYNPRAIEGSLVIIVGFMGIIVNSFVAYMFFQDRHRISIGSAYINMIFDALASAGALFSGLIIYYSNILSIDVYVSGAIGILLITNAYTICKDSLHLLLEGSPKHLQNNDLASSLSQINHVGLIKDLHTWALSCNETALSCQLYIDKKGEIEINKILRTAKQMLYDKHNIKHSTIEIRISDQEHHFEHEQICS